MNRENIERLLGSGILSRPEINTADTTVGAATLTAAAVAGGVITRSGSTAAYTDTLPTAALTIAAMPGTPTIDQSWILKIKNTVAFLETLSAGTGWTLSGLTTVPPLSVGVFLVTYSAAGTFTCVGLGSHPIGATGLVAKYQTAALATGTLTAGQITGADHVFMETTTDGAATMTTRTATQMFADHPNAQVGGTYLLTLINSGNNTLTLSAGTGVTITGTATVATTVTRTFHVTFDSATAMTFQGVSVGSIEAT